MAVELHTLTQLRLDREVTQQLLPNDWRASCGCLAALLGHQWPRADSLMEA